MPIQILPDPLSLLRPVSKVITASRTRPANATAYAAGQILTDSTTAATMMSFASCARSNGLGGLLDYLTVVSQTAPLTAPDLELHLFDTAPSLTSQNDASVFNPTDTELEKAIFTVTISASARIISAPLASNGNSEWHVPLGGKSFQCAAADTALYGIVVVRSAYTPTSGEKFSFRLHCIQD